MNNSLTLFAFRGKGESNISESMLNKLTQGKKIYIESEDRSTQIESLLNNIYIEQPGFVLGHGQYSGRDQDKIRIESVCKNRFRNQVICEST